jgi:tyrosine-protein phosphatase SIW14
MEIVHSRKSFIPRVALTAVALLTPFLMSAAEMSVPGIERFHKVNEKVYRGAQPNAQGFQALAKLGVKTVVDLRESGSRSVEEQKMVTAAGMKYVSIPMQGLATPVPADIARAAAILNDEAAGPVFVHCRQGVDRTGTVVAVYRMNHDKWDNAKAMAEAKAMGMHWIQKPLQGFIRNYHPETVVATAATGAGTPEVATAASAPAGLVPATIVP